MRATSGLDKIITKSPDVPIARSNNPATNNINIIIIAIASVFD